MSSSSTVGVAWRSSPLALVGFVVRGRPESGLSLALREVKRMSLRGVGWGVSLKGPARCVTTQGSCK